MATKSVDREAMALAAKQIEEKTSEIHKMQSMLKSEMETLRGTWRGRASDVFQQGYAQFDGEIEKVKGGLDQIHGSLVLTQHEYTSREEENQQSANQILGLLGGQ